jgi:hypothetical protein
MRDDSDKLDRFSRAFSSHTAGCRRECKCGRVFYDASGSNGWDWSDGEFETLSASKATALYYAVETLVLEGVEYVSDCDCWHHLAKKFIQWIDTYNHQIAAYLNGEQAHAEAAAKVMPTVKAK